MSNIDPIIQAQLSSGNHAIPEIDDPDLQANIAYVEKFLAGGTVEKGLEIGQRVLQLARDGELKYCLILEGEKDRSTVVAKETPTNIGILQAFNMEPHEIDTIRGGSTIQLGSTGLTAFMQPVINPRRDLTEAEVKGLTARLRNGDGTCVDDDSAGYVIFPNTAIRAIFENVSVADPELPFIMSQQ